MKKENFLNKMTYLCKDFLEKGRQRQRATKTNIWKQFYSGYYTLALHFLIDLFNIIKENFNKRDVAEVKEKTREKCK